MEKNGLLDTKRFTNISVFSRSNYQERDIEGNRDQSLKRVQYATGIRFIEDLEALDAMLGPHHYIYRVMGENESQVRGKVFNESEGEMEMAFGSLETMDDKDHEVCVRMVECIAELARQEDTALVLPLSMKGHIDHFIVHYAGEQVMNRPGNKATFYFAEDKPYAGLMNQEESAIVEAFIDKYGLADRAFQFDPERVLKLAYRHYPSQVDKIYDEGVGARVKQLKALYGMDVSIDRIYKFATNINSRRKSTCT
jgi:hypothetical protein